LANAILEKKFLLKVFDKMPKVISFVVSHAYTLFITVFGFAIFYFDKDLIKNLGYLFGVGTSGLTDIMTNSVVMGNIFLLAAGLVLAVPIAKPIAGFLREKKLLPYSLERIIKTVFIIAVFAVCTTMLAGNSYSPFLYFRF